MRKNLALLVLNLLSFFLVSFVLLLKLNATSALSRWGAENLLFVYTTEDMASGERMAIEEHLQRLKPISLEWVGPDQAKLEFLKVSPDLAADGNFALPTSVRVVFPMNYEVGNIIAELKSMPAVTSVDYGEEWIKSLRSLKTIFDQLTWLVVSVVLASGLVSVLYQVQEFLEKHRQEIEVYELLGFSNGRIRKPIYLQVLGLTGVAMLAALVLLGLGYKICMQWLESEAFFVRMASSLRFFSIAEISLGVFCVLCLAGMFVHFQMGRLNTGWSASQLRKP